jgi:hypothetical protein
LGPIIQFDKSALQSFNPDEALWCDNFYTTVITPIFFVETLADLSKEMAKGRTPEQVVGNIAYKTPEMGAFVVANHWDLRVANLLGYPIEMQGRPPIAGGIRTQLAGDNATVYEVPQEMRAAQRWQSGDFLGVEREFARRWRSKLANMDFSNIDRILRSLGAGKVKPGDLAEARAWSEQMVRGDGRRYKTLEAAFKVFGVAPQLQSRVLTRWKEAGRPGLDEFAPYAAYNLKVDLFFYLSLQASLISSQRASNRVDIAYLYYLPFCMIFTSGDRPHENISPLFLREDQEFLWAPKLKEDLGRLDAHYDKLPESTKAQGIMRFASTPPKEGDYLTAKLWDRYLPAWREPHVPTSDRMTAKAKTYAKALSDQAKPARKANGLRSLESGPHDPVAFERHVHARKGKWQIMPPELTKTAERVDTGRREEPQ